MRRREFIALGAAAAGWPLAARGQQPTMPIIGLLGHPRTPSSDSMQAFREGLSETGYIEDKNVVIEFRVPGGQSVQDLVTDFVRRQISVIVTAPAIEFALAAKAATSTIPIVFNVGSDPVKLGLVPSMNRPGGNLTGVTNLNVEVGPKRLEFLHQMLPRAVRVGLLVNHTNPNLETITRELQEPVRNRGLELNVLHASSEEEIDKAFASLAALRVEGLIIAPDALFARRQQQLAALALRHGIPAVYSVRNFVLAGGLMSYGAKPAEPYRVLGSYTGRVLKGEKPGDLPVHQVTKVELAINLSTAKTFGITVPASLLARADEVIE